MPLWEYQLPPERIAQEPCEPRDLARLLVVDRAERSLGHYRFADLPQLLHAGDLLILNNTRVLHARLLGRRAGTGGKWEGLFLRMLADGSWEMLSQTRGRLQPGEKIRVEPGPLELTLLKKLPGGSWLARPNLEGEPARLLENFGHVPLPPYIRKGQARAEDRGRYQTMYADKDGAVAAPTAGLHFTDRVFAGLKERGIDWAFVTLHVGLGTFQPMQSDDPAEHKIHEEWGELSAATAALIGQARDEGRRVIAVGTTSVRVLETAARGGMLEAWGGTTDIFIHPPYDFRVVDGLITNFHLPRTTLLLLVAAFAGVELLETAYRKAIAEKYRFYSYGDAMLIL